MRKMLFLIGIGLASPFLPLACSDTGTTTWTTAASSSGMGDGSCVDDSDCNSGFNLVCLPTDDGMCGPQTKKCVEYPPSCGEGTFTTVCGCDGKSHAKGPCPSELTYQIDTRPDSCVPAAGTFFCGDGACTIGGQYCVEEDTSVDCLDLPANCMGAQATCACLGPIATMSCGCTELPGGGIVINGCGI